MESKVEDLVNRASRLEGIYESILSQGKKLEQEVKELSEEIEVLKKVSELFKFLLKKLMVEKVELIEKLVTFGLRAVFQGKNLNFKVKQSYKRDKVYVDFVTEEDGVEASTLEAFGGGVALIESFILRVIKLLEFNLRRVLILDESFSMLHGQEYIERTSQLIKRLCEKFKIDVLLVTQKEGMKEFADHVYKANKKAGKLVLEKEK